MAVEARVCKEKGKEKFELIVEGATACGLCFIALFWRHVGLCFMGLDWRHGQLNRWTFMFSCVMPTITRFIPISFMPTSGITSYIPISCIPSVIPIFILTSGTLICWRRPASHSVFKSIQRIAVLVARTGLRHSLYVGARSIVWNARAGRQRPWGWQWRRFFGFRCYML